MYTMYTGRTGGRYTYGGIPREAYIPGWVYLAYIPGWVYSLPSLPRVGI